MAMQDRMHQPYRANLVPGLSNIIESVTPSSYPGVLGVCLSGDLSSCQHPHKRAIIDVAVGAGPTILALATHNFDTVAKAIIKILVDARPDTRCHWQLLEPAYEGATVNRID